MSPSQVAKTVADGLPADLFFCGVLASLLPHPKQKVGLERVVEIRDL